jgi:hypothetical protein
MRLLRPSHLFYDAAGSLVGAQICEVTLLDRPLYHVYSAISDVLSRPVSIGTQFQNRTN